MAIVLSLFFIVSTVIITIFSLNIDNKIIDVILNVSIGFLSSSFVALLLAILT